MKNSIQIKMVNATVSGSLKAPVYIPFNERGRFHRRKFKIDTTTFFVYSNGKFIALGVRDLENLAQQIQSLATVLGLANLGGAVKTHLSNAVYHGYLDRRIDLTTLKARIKKPFWLDYEPELYPAAIVRNRGKKGTALLFRSGKFILTGFLDEKSAQLMMNQIFADTGLI